MKKIYFYDTDGKTRLDELVQWDINRKILVKASDINISDSPPEVHFSNENTKEAYVTETTISGDFVELTLPNKLMQQPFTIMAYIYVWDSATSAKTKYILTIPVVKRQRPANYIYSDNILYFIGIPRANSVTTEKIADGAVTKEKLAPDAVVCEDTMSDTSENPVQNKVIKAYVDEQDSTKVDKGLTSEWGQNNLAVGARSEISSDLSGNTAVGESSNIKGSSNGSVALGYGATVIGSYSTAIGANTDVSGLDGGSTQGGTAIGYNTSAKRLESTAIGAGAHAEAIRSVQIGQGYNYDEYTLQFRDYTMLDRFGKIPNERITSDSTMSDQSTNPVQNRVVKGYVDGVVGDITTILDSLVDVEGE